MLIDFKENEIEVLKAALNAWTRDSYATFIKYNIEAVQTMRVHADIHEKLLKGVQNNGNTQVTSI